MYPLFAAADVADLHLAPGSPCIGRGDDGSAPGGDYDGDSRPLDGDGDSVARADIGADEFAGRLALLRAELSVLDPRTPQLSAIYPFAETNPLTPVIVPDARSGTNDPDRGILTRAGSPLVLYQLQPASLRQLLLIADRPGETVALRLR